MSAIGKFCPFLKGKIDRLVTAEFLHLGFFVLLKRGKTKIDFQKKEQKYSARKK